MKSELKKKQLSFSIDKELHKRLKVVTALLETSMTQFIVDALCEKLEKEENRKDK